MLPIQTGSIVKEYPVQSVEVGLGTISCICILNNPMATLLVADSIGFVTGYINFDQEPKNDEVSYVQKDRILNFQAHQVEFDYLKSTEIEAKISCMCEVPIYNQNSFSFLTATDKTIKYFTAYDKDRNASSIKRQKLSHKSKQKYGCHSWNINSISPSINQTQFISSDDLCVNLWNYEYPKTAYGN